MLFPLRYLRRYEQDSTYNHENEEDIVATLHAVQA
jgi:hypothetical protein